MVQRRFASLFRAYASTALVLSAAAWFACTPGDHPTAIRQQPPPVVGARPVALLESCGSSCTIVESAAPLWSAIANPDSVALPVDIATVTLVGAVGDSVSLALVADSTMASALPSDELVSVAAGDSTTSIPLRTLTTPTVVIRLATGDTTTIHYSLNRRLASVPAGSFALTQQTSAQVLSAITPWVTFGGAGIRSSVAANTVDPCSGDEPVNAPGAYCGVTVAFSQYAPADAFLAAGAEFQSNVGHGVSQPITITFSNPVSSVTVTAYDPTFNGNQMQAFDASGASLAVIPFPGNGRPGTLTTQTGTANGSISRVLLTPAPLDYVAYSMLVTFAAPTTLSVSSAAGPDSGGSFTVLSAESRVAMQATVAPATLATRVKWLVDDDPSDLVQTVSPVAVPDGTPSAFNVPVAQLRSRYAAYSHPGNLDQKSLALRVRAQVTDDNGQTVTSSNTVTVKQDEIDTMREEYIELHVFVIPARSEFRLPDAMHPDSADYRFVVTNLLFDAKFAQLVTDWSERPLLNTITGPYRNPVHHWLHVDTTATAASPFHTSWHLWGCAMDLQTYPVLSHSSTRSDTLAARAYWDRLSSKAVTLGFIVEQRDHDPNHPTVPNSGVGHVHVDIHCR